MPHRQRPSASKQDTSIERRRQPRTGLDSMDWETKVLKRVERHVESLIVSPTSGSDALGEVGWEEASLLALRRRVADLNSE